MNFNATKSHILSVKNKSDFSYNLDGVILERVKSHPYHGLTIPDDLKWHSHISVVTKTANSTLGFLRRS